MLLNTKAGDGLAQFGQKLYLCKVNTTILLPENDPMGTAITEYLRHGRAGRLRVLSSMFDEDAIPVEHLFRDVEDMPKVEQEAMAMAKGRILDVGAGAGCHALALQEAGKDVTAIDISQLSCDAMVERGISKVRCINLFDEALEGPFDTILMLMNGTGIAGKLSNMPTLLARVKALLAPGGQLLIDSSDLKYLYENEDGSYDIDLMADYYGEVDFRMIYKKVKGEKFDWLYLDYMTLAKEAAAAGLRCELVYQGEENDYLAKIG